MGGLYSDKSLGENKLSLLKFGQAGNYSTPDEMEKMDPATDGGLWALLSFNDVLWTPLHTSGMQNATTRQECGLLPVQAALLYTKNRCFVWLESMMLLSEVSHI